MKKKYLEWIFYSVLIVTISAMVSAFIVSGADYGAWNFDHTNEYESNEVVSDEDLSFEDESVVDVPDAETTTVVVDEDVSVEETTVVADEETTTAVADEDVSVEETTTAVADEDVSAEETTTAVEDTTAAPETTTAVEGTTAAPETTTVPAEDKTDPVLESVSDDAVVNTEAFCVTIATAKNYYADVVAMFGNDRVEIYNADGYELEDNDYVGTGCVIRLYDADGNYVEYRIIVMCDLDGNGKVTANDARETLRGAVGLSILSDLQTVAGNIDGNDILTAADARKVLRKAAGLDL